MNARAMGSPAAFADAFDVAVAIDEADAAADALAFAAAEAAAFVFDVLSA